MYNCGKIGICLEAGPIAESEKYVALAEKTVLQFLKHFGMIDANVKFSRSPKRIIKASYSVIRKSKNYYLKPGLRNFQKFKAGEVFGHQAGEEFVAKADDLIIFPRTDPMIGAEAFLIGREEVPLK